MCVVVGEKVYSFTGHNPNEIFLRVARCKSSPTALRENEKGTLISQGASLRQMNCDSAAEPYLHSVIGYCRPCEMPMKTLFPALQRLMQVLTSVLHLAVNIAA